MGKDREMRIEDEDSYGVLFLTLAATTDGLGCEAPFPTQGWTVGLPRHSAVNPFRGLAPKHSSLQDE